MLEDLGAQIRSELFKRKMSQKSLRKWSVFRALIYPTLFEGVKMVQGLRNILNIFVKFYVFKIHN